MSFWSTCTHPTVTDADEDGIAICTTCGTSVQSKLTATVLLRQFEAVRRDFGSYGRHSMRCVETPDGWCCADDCRMR